MARFRNVSRILIMGLSELGHLIPTFRMARSLEQQGHDVCYCLRPPGPSLLEPFGFSSIPLFPTEEVGGEFLRSVSRECELITKGALDRVFEQYQPDLLLCDTLRPLYMAPAVAGGITTLRFCTSFPLTEKCGYPPPDYFLKNDGQSYEDECANAWRELHARDVEAKSLIVSILAKVLDHYAMPHDTLVYNRSLWQPDFPQLPELYLVPRPLDFPRPSDDHEEYGQALPEAGDDDEIPADWEPSKTIYFSRGSTWTDTRALEATLDFARRSPELRFLLSVREIADEVREVSPPNCRVVSFCKQPAVLKKVAAAVVAPGLGTLKECAREGVPMLTIPLDDVEKHRTLEQSGNINRMLYHDLGHTCAPEEIANVLPGLLTNPPEGAAKMKSAIADFEEGDSGMRFVERAL